MRYLSAVFLLLSTLTFAQQITLIDATTREPVVGAAVFNADKSKAVLSGFDGEVDISAFAKAEPITISELAHVTITTTKEALLAQGPKIYLAQAENTLSEVVLSASKFAQSASKVPQKIVGISSNQVALFNPQTAADLLESSGQVFVQKSQLGGGSPMIRGFSTNRLLITVDGVRFNTAIFRSGNVQNVISIDPFALERTEVILGPGSVVYGSDAIGGVMNFYSKTPQLSVDGTKRFSGNSLARYSTANQEKTGHFDFTITSNKWAFLTSASFSDYEDQRMGSNGPADYLRISYVRRIDGEDVEVLNNDPEKQLGTGFNSYSLLQKIRFVPNESWDINLGLHYSATSDVPRYDRLIQRDDDGNLRSAQWFYGPQRWFMTNFQIKKEGSGPFYDRMRASLAYQYFEESRNDRSVNSQNLRTRTERVNAYNAALDFTKDLGGSKNKLFYGVEFIYDYVGSTGESKNSSTGATTAVDTRYPDGSDWSSLAAYASGQFTLSKNLSMITGLRYNHIFLNADFTGNNTFFNFPFEEALLDFGNFTGSVGFNYSPSDILTFKTNFSTAFRAPNVDDIGKIFESGGGDIVVPNPDLEAEYAYNGEMGADIRFRESATNRTLFAIQINGFYTHLVDALVRRDYNLNGESSIEYQGETVNVQAIQNSGRATIYGLELGAEVAFTKDLKLRSQFNITTGDQEEADGSPVPVRHVSPTFGNTQLIWEKNKLKLNLFAEYNGSFDASELSPEEVDKPWLYALDARGNPFSPDWYTLNVTGQYQVTDALKATASIENMTDQRYRTYSSGIAAPGRNLILALNYTF